MLNSIRNFAKTKMAGVLVGILIVPFVLWGMGGVFSGGNTNNIAEINNQNISTKDFMTFLNNSNLTNEEIRNNIDKNILEENLTKLISATMLSMEIENLGLIISDKVLKKSILESLNFKDENNKFSRTKYEKFLLSTGQTAPEFELILKENELKKVLFNYISGGIKTPTFLIKNNYKEQTKKITLNFINLSNIYKKKENFTDQEISEFINKNKDSLKEKFISFKYSKITPKDLIGLNEYNNLFFEKIDEIEGLISAGAKIDDLAKNYNLKLTTQSSYKINEENKKNNFLKKIYEKGTKNKIELLDENDFYVIYEITHIDNVLPDINEKNFRSKIKEKLFNVNKFELNNNLIKEISDKKFSENDFIELARKNSVKIKKIIIDGINDNNKFSKDSVVFLYTLSKNNFGLIGDKEKNIFLIKIIDINYKKNLNISDNHSNYEPEEKEKIVNQIFESYDFILNEKYKVKINEKTLERVKNYFR